jgi:hypothetical protein
MRHGLPQAPKLAPPPTQPLASPYQLPSRRRAPWQQPQALSFRPAIHGGPVGRHTHTGTRANRVARHAASVRITKCRCLFLANQTPSASSATWNWQEHPPKFILGGTRFPEPSEDDSFPRPRGAKPVGALLFAVQRQGHFSSPRVLLLPSLRPAPRGESLREKGNR